MKKSSFVNALSHEVADKRIEVLRLIKKTGSISQAAREAKVSYKAAWQAIQTLTNLAGVPLVEKNVGGVGGGGATLTHEGEKLLSVASQLEIKRKQYLEELTENKTILNEEAIPPLGIQTSMRNYLPCHIKRMTKKDSIVRVEMVLKDQSTIFSHITATSAELLALKTKLPVIALCKAMSVQITKEKPKAIKANFLEGTVSDIVKGNNAHEVSIILPSGIQIVGFSKELFKEGEKAIAQIDESTVVIALRPKS